MRSSVHATSVTLALATLTSLAVAQTPPGACILNDAAFTTADGGCKDQATGAIWSAETPVGGYDFVASYCANLLEGGFDDWRMPTMSELEEFCANGAFGHVAQGDPGYAYYSKTNGQVGSIIRLDTCSVTKKIAVKGSYIHGFCVRGGNPKPGKGKKESLSGGTGTPGAEGVKAVDRNLVQVQHEVKNGSWRIHVVASRFGKMPYALIVSGLPLSNSTSVQGLFAGLGGRSTVVLGGLKELDARGQADVVVKAPALDIQPADSKWYLSMVVLDPTGTGGVRAVIPLVVPRSVTPRKPISSIE